METLNSECRVCPAMTWWPVTGLFLQEYTHISGSKEKSAPHSDSTYSVTFYSFNQNGKKTTGRLRAQKEFSKVVGIGILPHDSFWTTDLFC